MVPVSEAVNVLVIGIVMDVLVGLMIIGVVAMVPLGVVTLVNGAPPGVGVVGTAAAPDLPWPTRYDCTGVGSDLNQGSVTPALNSDAMIDETSGWFVNAILRSEGGSAVSKMRRISPLDRS